MFPAARSGRLSRAIPLQAAKPALSPGKDCRRAGQPSGRGKGQDREVTGAQNRKHTAQVGQRKEDHEVSALYATSFFPEQYNNGQRLCRKIHGFAGS